MSACAVAGCDRPVHSAGLCGAHDSRKRRGADMGAPVKRQVTRSDKAAWRADIEARYTGGETLTSIAASYGMRRPDTLSKWVREWGTPPPPKTITHGIPSAWMWHKCRCEVCTAARREYKRAERERRHAQPVTAEHGTLLGYQQGCRCAECEEAMREYLRQRNHRTRPAARNHGKRWTGPDAEIAFRTDLSIEERAALLGRTYAAVDDFIRGYMRRGDDPFGVKRS